MSGDTDFYLSYRGSGLVDRWSRILDLMGDRRFLYFDFSRGFDNSGCDEYVLWLKSLIEVSDVRSKIKFSRGLVTFIGLCEEPTGLLFRSIDAKEFHTFSFDKPSILCYFSSSFLMERDKFGGGPIVVLEGALKAECFSYVVGYPYVVSNLGVSCSVGFLCFLLSLTDTLVVVADNDVSGRRGAERTKGLVTDLGGRCYVYQVRGAKDFDEVFESGVKEDIEGARSLLGSLVA